MKSAWRRIHTWFKRNVKEPPEPEYFVWGSGASERDIEQTASKLGVNLPDDVRESYQVYDGTNGKWVMESGYLLSLHEVLENWSMMKQGVEEGYFAAARPNPKGPIKKNWWNVRWIPVAHNGGGDYYCVDLDPAKGGSVGQVIKFDHETGPSHVVAATFGSWLASYATDLESGKFTFDPDLGSAKRVST